MRVNPHPLAMPCGTLQLCLNSILHVGNCCLHTYKADLYASTSLLLTLRSAGAILLVSVPATIIASDWRGLGRKMMPNLQAHTNRHRQQGLLSRQHQHISRKEELKELLC
jgi:hypothetical protein